MAKEAEKVFKKGLSTVITTLIIILISLSAVIVVWVVIQNIVESGSDEVDAGQYTIDLDIQKVHESDSGTEVVVKRNPGRGSLKEITFVISDGTNSYSFKKDASVKELGQQTFLLDYFGPLKSVAILPTSEQGAQGNPTDLKDFSAYDSVMNMPGLVSWWRMEGNANDEMGRNHGLVNGGSFVSGKFGDGFEANAPGERIVVPHDVSLQLEDANMTLLAWTYISSVPVHYILSPVAKGKILDGDSGYQMYLVSNAGITYGFVTVRNTTSIQNANIPVGKWTHLGGYQFYEFPGKSIVKSYIEGNLISTSIADPSTAPNPTTEDFKIGGDTSINFGDTYINGVIDEVMIFNRTLSDAEIQALYNLDLNN